ncbi:hypothetical protein GCM10010176_077470 [Nonomuraea spiralis]|nr:hypothetical protein GCM10010176_077470 [Nonomuraea spiralis]
MLSPDGDAADNTEAAASVTCDAEGRRGPQCPGHHCAVLPGGHVETTLTGKIERLLLTGSHDGRPAFCFLMRDVDGVPSLSST